MKLYFELNNMVVNFEATTSGNEMQTMTKLRALLEDLAGFENVALSVNTFSAPKEEQAVVVNPQAAWPFPMEPVITYDDMPLEDDEDQEPSPEPQE